MVCLLVDADLAAVTRTQDRIALTELKLNKVRDNLYEIEGSEA